MGTMKGMWYTGFRPDFSKWLRILGSGLWGLGLG